MAITTGTVPNRLAETLILDADADNTSETNIFSGVTLADKIYCIYFDNSAIAAASYVKAQYRNDAYVVTSGADIKLYAPANSIVTYLFPDGLPVTTGISFIGTSTTATADPQSDVSGGTITVRILGGT
tara:strand:+ start:567 stop:950 length:384 start_codon:yes stop_codon:yes gene_type:complete